jgi:von Willebrand factor type A domain
MAGGGKMTNLKSSVDSALASLLDSGGKNVSDTKVGIVPFDVRVRIAKGSGLPHINYNLDPTLCTSSNPTGCNPWDGFVTDRNQSFDVSATTATPSDPSSLYPAVFSASKNLAEVMGLTTDIKAARDSVATFKPAGNTNITIGVQWGMEVLSPDGPYTGGVAFNDPNTKKYMILVTDGDNTQNRWTSSTTSIDNRTKLACEAAKAKGITIFVVRVMNGNSALLKSCASKPEYYYDLSNASQLDKTLKDVFSSLKKARLTQ